MTKTLNGLEARALKGEHLDNEKIYNFLWYESAAISWEESIGNP